MSTKPMKQPCCDVCKSVIRLCILYGYISQPYFNKTKKNLAI